MSERMIELRRQQMGLPPTGSSPSAPIHSPSPSQAGQQSTTPVQQTPQQAAAADLRSEDSQLQRLMHRLQRRDDSHPLAGSSATSSSGPTVPTALSRRMLHRQGVGYVDDTVAAVISASADRFLGTVLQQAVACRDQRLKGAAMAIEAARHRKRHIQHYEADNDDRKRRKEGREAVREAHHLRAIAAADALRKGGGSKDSDDKKSKKKKKKEEPAANGVKQPTLKLVDGDDDEESYDSIDEEEEYYQENQGEEKGLPKRDDYEDDDTLLLRDLVRPLEAWDFHLTGKEALEVQDSESEEEEGEEEEEENEDSELEENGNDVSSADGGKADSKHRDDTDKDAKKKVAPSPAKNAS